MTFILNFEICPNQPSKVLTYPTPTCGVCVCGGVPFSILSDSQYPPPLLFGTLKGEKVMFLKINLFKFNYNLIISAFVYLDTICISFFCFIHSYLFPIFSFWVICFDL